MSKLLISQSENFKGNFGEVLRSSAIFYFIQNKQYSTTISFLNYWFVRRELDVTVIISLRDMAGNLIRRERATFDRGMVFNFQPNCDVNEGSIEVEVFSLENLVIPYAAVMAVYQSPESVSMVHSYTRTYSQHEVEEKRTITNGRESCWTIKDSDDVSSFCVLHNGSIEQAEQRCDVTITTSNNDSHQFEITIPKLLAYSTYRINLKEHIPDIVTMLEGNSANASISFELGNSFTRLLVGNQNDTTNEMQITHSNFNYQEHLTDFIKVKDPAAYLSLLSLSDQKVIVYPDTAPGSYSVTNGNENIAFSNGMRLEYSPESDLQIFKSESGLLPSRIVTAVSGGNTGRMPFECSLGVMHEKRPPKRMWWGLIGDESSLKSRIMLTLSENIYGEYDDEPLYIRIYSAKQSAYLEVKCHLNDLKIDSGYVYVGDLFEQASEFLGGELGYYTLYSDYPGFFVYSSLENENSSLSIEHGF